MSTPKLSRPYLSCLSYHNACQPIYSSPTHAVSSAVPYERNLTVVTTCFHRLWVSLPWSYGIPTSCQSFFSTTPGRTPTRTSTLSTYFVIQELTSICSPETQASSFLTLRPTERCALFPTPPLNCLSQHNLRFSSSTRLQPVAVEGPDWAETLPVICAGRLSFVGAFNVHW